MDRLKTIYKKMCDNNYIFFYLSVLSLVFGKSLGMYSGNIEYKLILYFSMVCLGLKLLCTHYTKKEFICIAVTIVYAGFIFLKTGYITFSISAVMICGVKGIDITDLLKKMLFVKIICMAVVISASAFGIIANKEQNQFTSGMAYSFGYQSPNEFMTNVVVTIIILFYVNYDKLNALYFILAAYAFYATYIATNSRTGMMLGFMFVLAILAEKLLDRMKNIGILIKRIVSLCMIPMSLFCFLGTMFFSIKFDVSNGLYFKLDQLVSGRLKIQHQYWLNYGFSVLGKDISKAAARFDGVQINNGILDNNYLCSFYKYGVITEIIFIAFLILGSYYYYKKKEYNVVIIINLMCLYGLMEDFMISSVVNPFLMFAGIAIFNFGDLLNKQKRSKT